MRKVQFVGICLLLAGCGLHIADDNDTAVYAKESGLPVNCRAYVQAVVDGYRNGRYSADQSMSGLERNCGFNGTSWKNNR